MSGDNDAGSSEAAADALPRLDAAPSPEADTDTVDPVDEGATPEPAGPSSVEELIVALETIATERDEYLDLARRTQAEFENHRKRVIKQQADEIVRASASLVEQLLPVLDACDGAMLHGAAEVEPIFAALLQTLEKQGLERIDPEGEEFDPNRHEAVMHEPAGEEDEGTIVSDVMRAGYAWKGHVVRPAMVRVRG